MEIRPIKRQGLGYGLRLSFKKLGTALVALVTVVMLTVDKPAAEQTTQFDIIIRDANVLDGTGRPSYRADIGIRAGVIARIGKLSGINAARTINASAMYVTPGFIDMHSHINDAFGSSQGRIALNNLLQGITTVVVGQDGDSAWSGNEMITDASSRWSRLGLAANAILLVGHGSVRGAVMGNANRAPTDKELDRMRELVRQAMQGGAYGLSTGLYYEPGKFAQTDEVIALTREIKPYSGFYISHVRDETDQLNQSVEELIRIGKETGVPVVHTHFKVMGKPNFGKAKAALDLLEKARRAGVQVWADMYPWTISWGAINIDLSWAVSLPQNNPAVEQEVRRQLAPELCTVMNAPDSQYVGRTLAEIESSTNASLIETIVRFHKMGARINCVQMSEPDIEAALRRNFMAFCTDGGNDLSLNYGHPRTFATYPRFIREYVLRRGVITLPHAIRAATGLPADIMKLNDRGYLREGKMADILVFDPKQINYCASYTAPKCHSTGIQYMLVNGVLTLDGGSYTDALAGRVLLRR
jgi:N-acyl-D-amino-acid deacylase